MTRRWRPANVVSPAPRPYSENSEGARLGYAATAYDSIISGLGLGLIGILVVAAVVGFLVVVAMMG